MAAPKLKMRLGDLLVHENIISNEQLTQALTSQKHTGRKLGDTLIELSYLSEKQLLKFLAQQLDLPFLDIAQYKISPDVASLLPEVHARRLRALIIEDRGPSVLLGMSEPSDLSGLDQLERMLSPKRIELAIVMEAQIFDAFDSLYRRTAEIESFASQLEEEYKTSLNFDLDTTFLDEAGDATVGKLLQSVFQDAAQMRASDIHIEPEEHQIRIRQRIDGLLQEKILKENKIASAMVSRLKLMAGLDISEKRLPQDGRFNLDINGHNIDVRMSTMPVQYGESVVMRLLDQSAGLLSLEQTGMPKNMIERLRLQIRRPHGLVLVTGPTGSGKTTTLYAALSELNEATKKIITVEDPIEYRLPRINQVQVNLKMDLTFASVLRTALRQDPDIMMVGEMRDQETVEIGLRGAITGHLVLSTLHTNDAITSAMRLVDMGAAGFQVGSALRAVVAQRLVRRVCESCSTEYQVDEQELFWLTNLAGEQAKNAQYMRGKGCQTCQYTGYKGRIGIFELLEMNEEMVAALKRNDSDSFSKLAKANPTFTPLAKAAFDHAIKGLTTVEEVLRMVETIDINKGLFDSLNSLQLEHKDNYVLV